MSSSQHGRAGEVFLKARGLTGGERKAYLDQACATDSSLRAEVASLLAAESQDTISFLREGPLVGPQAASMDGRHLEGQRIGQYTLHRVIGSGGMGTVFEATQERPRRRVALKTMRSGLLNPSILKRFEYESQVLAMLRHPGIAQVYEAGIHESPSGKVPYFVMEFIEEGGPIHEYARAKVLDIRERLALFVSVCDAVEHAHRNGVIHRDLKPDNVLVDKQGQPKVIDFGIARLVQPDGRTPTLHTTLGEVVGTIPYLSPEQAAGQSKQIDTRTDVYTLGVILYELLTDRFPYAVDGGLADVLRHILNVGPTSPRVYARLGHEVETIVLKCLQEDRDRRYQSAGELARDIERYLKGEAIEAKRDSQWYVLRKIARRHRALLGVAAAFVLLVTASAIALTFLYTEQRRERQRAERQAYIANIAAADHAIANNDAGEALKRLHQAPQHLRQWEWHYLFGHADLSRFTLPAPQRATHVAFSPNGANLAISYWSGAVRVWNFSSGRFTWERNEFADPIMALGYVADARILAATGKAWGIFDAATGEEIARGEAPECSDPMPFNADGSRFACGKSEDRAARYALQGSIAVKDTRTSQLIQEFPNLDNRRYVPTAAFSPGGRWLATGDIGGTLRIWDVESGRPLITTQQNHGRPYGMTFSPNGQQLATGHEEGTVALWDTASGECVRFWPGHSQRVWEISFSPDGSLLATASQDKSARIWRAGDGSPARVLRGHAAAVTDTEFNSQGDTVATVSLDGSVKLWDIKTTSQAKPLLMTDAVRSVAFDATGECLAATSGSLTVICEPATGREIQEWCGETIGGRAWLGASFSSDGSKLFVGNQDGSVRILEAATLTELGRLPAHRDEVWAVATSRDGRYLASASCDGRIVLWDAQRADPLHMLPGHKGEIRRVAFSPDSSTLASASADGTAKLWDVATGECSLTYAEHASAVHSVAYSPDGNRVASASDDGTFRIWNSATGETVRTVDGKMQDVWSIAYSPDGRRLVTGARDRTVRIWDAETGDELLTLRGPTGTVEHVAWSPDGGRIAAGTWNHEVFIWDAARNLAEQAAVGGGHR